MTTLHHLDVAIVDIRERLTRELQFSTDARRNIDQAFGVVTEALEALHRAIETALTERQRALSAALGNPGPNPETIEADDPPPRKPKLVKEGAA
jgi:hypothetical protein